MSNQRTDRLTFKCNLKIVRSLREQYDKKHYKILFSVYSACCLLSSEQEDEDIPIIKFSDKISEYSGIRKEAAIPAIKELCKKGFIECSQMKKEDGTFWGTKFKCAVILDCI